MKKWIIIPVLAITPLWLSTVLAQAPLKEVVDPAKKLLVPQGSMISNPSENIQGFVEFYEEWTGLEVSGDPEILGKEIGLSLSGPFTKREGARLLEMILKLNGYEISENPAGDGKLLIREVPFQLTEEQSAEAGAIPEYKGEEFEEVVIGSGDFFHLVNSTGAVLSEIFGQHIGKRVIFPHFIGQAEFSVKMKGPATRGEVAVGIRKALAEGGCGVIEAPGDLKTLWIVMTDEKKAAELRAQREGRRVIRTRYVPRPAGEGAGDVPKTRVPRTRYVPRPK